MSNITVYKFVKKIRQTSKQLLRKRQKTLGATFLPHPVYYVTTGFCGPSGHTNVHNADRHSSIDSRH